MSELQEQKDTREFVSEIIGVMSEESLMGPTDPEAQKVWVELSGFAIRTELPLTDKCHAWLIGRPREYMLDLANTWRKNLSGLVLPTGGVEDELWSPLVIEVDRAISIHTAIDTWAAENKDTDAAFDLNPDIASVQVSIFDRLPEKSIRLCLGIRAGLYDPDWVKPY